MSVTESPKRGLRPAQAAARMGVSVPTFWRYHRQNPNFPRVRKLSERVAIVDEAELDAFMAAPQFGNAAKVA